MVRLASGGVVTPSRGQGGFRTERSSALPLHSAAGAAGGGGGSLAVPWPSSVEAGGHPVAPVRPPCGWLKLQVPQVLCTC